MNEKEKDARAKGGILRAEITKELQESYLDYAMSVIVSRALPDVRDGLKPVQRRILWAMWDSGLTHASRFKKSANVVGEVLGKYHPHGDTAVYDAMVRMAQDFSLRYPLVNGQGNWGSIDGDSAAAMRYTEAKLTKISGELLADIERETVDWQSNYDASRFEPKVLPAGIPNLLLNGAMGIAVGMATNIPPHNLSETVDAALLLADNPKATVGDLMEFVKGPDFPTGGIIYDKKGMLEAYASGKGAITIRAAADIEERKNSQFNIVITEIPYQVNKSVLVAKIAELAQEKKVDGIKDIRDESGREGLRVVIELKSDAAPQKVLNQLFEYTELQKDFHMNMLALADGIQPRIMSLKDVLEHFLNHRKEVVRRRAEFDLKKAEERAHILEGLAKALDHIDQVIATIKKSEDRDDAHKNLVKKFKLSDLQAVAILEMRLQTLAALERKKVEDELKEKKKLIAELLLLLKSPAKILGVVKDELKKLKEAYGDARRTKVVAGGLKEFREEDLIPQEEAIITLTQGGYIKRVPPGSFKSQHRGGKGLIGFDVKEEDFLAHFSSANTHDNILFFTDRGRVFQTKVYEIPQGSRTAKGKLVHNFLDIPQDEKISAIVTYAAAKEPVYLVMATRRGFIKKTALSEFQNVRRSGIVAIKLKSGDLLKWVKISGGEDEIIFITARGQSIRFKEKQARPMGRAAAGVTAIKMKKDDFLSALDIIKKEAKTAKLLVVMENGFGKQTVLSQYKIQNRGGSGIKTAKITKKTGLVVGAKVIVSESELLALSAKGQIIRTELSGIRSAGRATQGVRVMNLKTGDKVAGIIAL
ncbi:MAG: DNA gyrase subunit A [Patescibacteria group bacterium]